MKFAKTTQSLHQLWVGISYQIDLNWTPEILLILATIEQWICFIHSLFNHKRAHVPPFHLLSFEGQVRFTLTNMKFSEMWSWFSIRCVGLIERKKLKQKHLRPHWASPQTVTIKVSIVRGCCTCLLLELKQPNTKCQNFPRTPADGNVMFSMQQLVSVLLYGKLELTSGFYNVSSCNKAVKSYGEM